MHHIHNTLSTISLSTSDQRSLLELATSVTSETIIKRLASHFRSIINTSQGYHWPLIITDFYSVILGWQQQLSSFQIQQLSLHSDLSHKIHLAIDEIKDAQVPETDAFYLKRFITTISYSWPGEFEIYLEQPDIALDPFHHYKITQGNVDYGSTASSSTQKVLCCSVVPRNTLDNQFGFTGLEDFFTGGEGVSEVIVQDHTFGQFDLIVPIYEIVLPREYFRKEIDIAMELFFSHNDENDDDSGINQLSKNSSDSEVDESMSDQSNQSNRILTLNSDGHFNEEEVDTFLYYQVPPPALTPALKLLRKFLGLGEEMFDIVPNHTSNSLIAKAVGGFREPHYVVEFGDKVLFPIEIKSHLEDDFGTTYQDENGNERFINESTRTVVLQLLKYMMEYKRIHGWVSDAFNGYILELTGDFYTPENEEERNRIYNSLNVSTTSSKKLSDDDIIRLVKFKKIRLSSCGTDPEGSLGVNSGMTLKFGFLCLVIRVLKDVLDLEFDGTRLEVKDSILDKIKEFDYDFELELFENFTKSEVEIDWYRKTTNVHGYLRPSDQELVKFAESIFHSRSNDPNFQYIKIKGSSSSEIKVLQSGDFEHAVVFEFPIVDFFTMFGDTLTDTDAVFLQNLINENDGEDSIILKVYDYNIQQYTYEIIQQRISNGELDPAFVEVELEYTTNYDDYDPGFKEFQWYVDLFKSKASQEIEAFERISKYNEQVSEDEILNIPKMISHGNLLMIDESAIGSMLCCGEFIAMLKINDDFSEQLLAVEDDELNEINQDLRDQLQKKIHNQLRQLANLKYHHSDLNRDNILLKKVFDLNGDVKEIKPYFISLAALKPRIENGYSCDLTIDEIQAADYAVFL